MKTTPITILATMALLAAISASSASAQQRIDQKRPASADGRVQIENQRGSVRVIGWDKNEVAVSGTLGEGVERLEFTGDSLWTFVRVVIPKSAQNAGDSDLEVRIPSNSRTLVNTVSGDIVVSKVAGFLNLNSVGGDIRASDSPREVVASSVGGDVNLSVSSPKVVANTVSGAVILEGVDGDVAVTNVNGEVSVKGGLFERVQFSTVNGDIRFDGDLAPKGTFRFNGVNATVDLLLPASVKADFQVSAKEIDNEFRPRVESKDGDYGPSVKRLNFSTGAGGASVTISTFNGSVRLRKKK